MTNTDKSSNIIVRILEEEIDYVEAGWRRFTFKFKERILEEGHLCNGSVDFDHYLINLDPGMPDDLALETVIHELLHVVLMTVGYGENEDAMIATKNEDLTVQVSRGWMQLYRLNPKLMMIISELMCKETPFKHA